MTCQVVKDVVETGRLKKEREVLFKKKRQSKEPPKDNRSRSSLSYKAPNISRRKAEG